MKNSKRVGLSLSGGGFRATIYHLGTLKKLKELDILDRIDVISNNSGGSITGASYGLYGQDFDDFEEILKKGVKSSIISSVLKSARILVPLLIISIWIISIVFLLFTSLAWLSLILFICFWIIFLFFQYQIFPISKLNEKAYNKLFFFKKSLSDFSVDSEIVINATNLETGTLFTFSKKKMGDSSYRYMKYGKEPIQFEPESFPIARAVAASTCVPFVFSPVLIHSSFYCNPDDTKRAKPRLVDGGIYDNQGIHKITQEKSSYKCDYVIVSDAGNIIPFKHSYRNVLALLIRTSDVFMERIKDFQITQNLYHNTKLDKREIGYQSLGWDLDKCIPGFIDALKNNQIVDSAIKAHDISKEDIDNGNWKKIEDDLIKKINYYKIVEKANTKEQLKIARSVKTNLVPLRDEEIDALINHAALITEIQVKLYCPSLLN